MWNSVSNTRGDKSSIAFLSWLCATFPLVATWEKWCPICYIIYISLWMIEHDCCVVSSSLTLRGATVHVAQLAKEQGPEFFLDLHFQVGGNAWVLLDASCCFHLCCKDGEPSWWAGFCQGRFELPRAETCRVEIENTKKSNWLTNPDKKEADVLQVKAFVSGFCKQCLAVLL